MDYYQHPIYAKEAKEIPAWMKDSHDWQNAVAVDKLPKYQLKVKMCCSKCEEKLIEEIREVHGVFDVRAEKFNSKVVVVAMPHGLNEHELLRKARKSDKKAKFVELDAKEKPKKEDEKKKEVEAEEKKKQQQAAISNVFYTWKPSEYWPGGPYGGPYHTPHPAAYYPGEYIGEFIIRQKKEEEKRKKEEEEKKKKKKEEEEKKKAEEASSSNMYTKWGGPSYAPQPYYPYYPVELREYRPSEWRAPPYHYLPLPFQPQLDEYSRPYFYYN